MEWQSGCKGHSDGWDATEKITPAKQQRGKAVHSLRKTNWISQLSHPAVGVSVYFFKIVDRSVQRNNQAALCRLSEVNKGTYSPKRKRAFTFNTKPTHIRSFQLCFPCVTLKSQTNEWWTIGWPQPHPALRLDARSTQADQTDRQTAVAHRAGRGAPAGPGRLPVPRAGQGREGAAAEGGPAPGTREAPGRQPDGGGQRRALASLFPPPLAPQPQRGLRRPSGPGPPPAPARTFCSSSAAGSSSGPPSSSRRRSGPVGEKGTLRNRRARLLPMAPRHRAARRRRTHVWDAAQAQRRPGAASDKEPPPMGSRAAAARGPGAAGLAAWNAPGADRNGPTETVRPAAGWQRTATDGSRDSCCSPFSPDLRLRGTKKITSVYTKRLFYTHLPTKYTTVKNDGRAEELPEGSQRTDVDALTVSLSIGCLNPAQPAGRSTEAAAAVQF